MSCYDPSMTGPKKLILLKFAYPLNRSVLMKAGQKIDKGQQHR